MILSDTESYFVFCYKYMPTYMVPHMGTSVGSYITPHVYIFSKTIQTLHESHTVILINDISIKFRYESA